MILLIPAISINGTRLSMIRLGLEDRWWWRSPLDVSAATSPTRANHCRPWFVLQLLSSDLVSKLEAKYSRSFHRYHRHSGRSSSTRIIRITQISAATAIQMMQVAITWPWMRWPLLSKITRFKVEIICWSSTHKLYYSLSFLHNLNPVWLTPILVTKYKSAISWVAIVGYDRHHRHSGSPAVACVIT